MLTQSSLGMSRVVTSLVASLKVAALVSILGAVVLAAEHQVGTTVTPEQTAPSASATYRDSQAESTAERAGPVAQQPASF